MGSGLGVDTSVGEWFLAVVEGEDRWYVAQVGVGRLPGVVIDRLKVILENTFSEPWLSGGVLSMTSKLLRSKASYRLLVMNLRSFSKSIDSDWWATTSTWRALGRVLP